MAIFTYSDIDALSNVIRQLPNEARARAGVAEQQDGTWELTLPDEFTDAVEGADPDVTPPAPVPPSVELFKARAVMATTTHGSGTLLEAADAAINGISDALDRQVARQGLQCSSMLTRNGRLISVLAEALDLDDDAVDDLFRAAAAVEG